VAYYPIACQIRFSSICKSKRRLRRIIDSAATDATQVVVYSDGGIISSLAAGKLQFLHLPQAAKQFKVPIHGAQAYLGNFSPDQGVKSSGRGMIFQFLEFLQNDFPLPGVSELFVVLHIHLLFLIVIITIKSLKSMGHFQHFLKNFLERTSSPRHSRRRASGVFGERLA
jgi:hypothetical protein